MFSVVDSLFEQGTIYIRYDGIASCTYGGDATGQDIYGRGWVSEQTCDTLPMEL